MKKSGKSSLKKKRPLDISLQHKNEATYKFSKKKVLHLAKKRAGGETVNRMTGLSIMPTTSITIAGPSSSILVILFPSD